MAMQSFPFTSEVTFDDSGFPQFDRAVGSDVLRSILSNYYTNGVFGIGNNNSFKVVASAGGGMSLTVQPGACLINGATGYNMDETRITLANGEAQPRIDSIVLRLDDNKAQRNIHIEVLKGTPQSQPIPPTPVREGAVYDLVLANVMVKANVVTITNADITDTRLDKNLCGFVNAINNLNLDTIYMQQITMFNDWFEGIKGQLSTDAAGNLQNQINSINPKITGIANDLKKTNDKMKWKYIGTLKQSNTRINISSEYSEVLAVYTSKGTSYDVKDSLVIPLSNAGYYDFFVDRTDKNAAHTFRFYNGTTYVLQNSLLKADDTIDIYVK